jgi:hypothetical protein
MANANINLIQLANTFNDQRICINNLANSVNELRNGNYYKDGGNFTLANGALFITSTIGTGLAVTDNAIFSALTTMNTSITTGLATFFDNVAAIGVNSQIGFANVVTGPVVIANNKLFSNGGLHISGANLAGNSFAGGPAFAFAATISGNACINVANNILASNAGNMEIKGNVLHSNATALLNVVGNVQISTFANIANANIVASNITVLNVIANAQINTLNLDPTKTFQIVNGNAILQTLNVTSNSILSNIASTMNIVGNISVGQTANINVANINTATIGTLKLLNSAEIDLLYLDPTHTFQIANGNAIFQNIQINGTQTLVGNVVFGTDTLVLRTNLATSGDAKLVAQQGTTNGNAVLRFSQNSGTWQTTANDKTTFRPLLTTANLIDSVFGVGNITNAPTANALSQLNNFVNGPVYGQANAAYTQANSAYAQANIALTAATGGLNTSGGIINGNLVVTGQTTTQSFFTQSTSTSLGGMINRNARSYFGKDGANSHWLSTSDNLAEPFNLAYGFSSNGQSIILHEWILNGLQYPNMTYTAQSGTPILNVPGYVVSNTVQINGQYAQIIQQPANNPPNSSLWTSYIGADGSWTFQARSDNQLIDNPVFWFYRAANTSNLTIMAYGNPMDSAPHQFYGLVNASAFILSNGANVSALATGSLQRSGGVITGNTTYNGNAILTPQLQGYRETSAPFTITGPFALNLFNSNIFDLTLEVGSYALTFANAPSPGVAQSITVILRQPSTTGNVVTYANTVKWSNGEVPVLSSGIANKLDILTFITVDGGITFYGAHAMANVG